MSQARPLLLPGAALTGIVLLIAAFFIGHATATTAASGSGSNPIAAIDGIPVGVQDTGPGALAAADNYVTEVSQTGEQNPALFTRFVRTVYAPNQQAATLTQAQQQRANDVANAKNLAAGGTNLAFVGARRLDSYTGATASVTSWLEVVSWGPLQPPKQGWVLVATRMHWGNGRWLVDSLDGTATPAPTPALAAPSSPSSQTAEAFGSALKNMTTPYYGTGS